MGEAVLKLKATSVEEYVRTEDDSPVKREYVDGQVYGESGTLKLSCPGLELSLDELYEGL